MESYYIGNGRRWVLTGDQVNNRLTYDSDETIPEFLEKLLIQRNIQSCKEASFFLNPTLEALNDPFLLDGMEIAVERIIRAIENQERVLIYGDYDVDGVTATSILINFFRSLNNPVDFYIPDRVDEGYGISDLAVEYISSQEYDLLITVDCGITSRFQVDAIYERCAKRGKIIDIIITDHHQCNEKLMPEALAVINPHIPGSNYPFKNLCGAGLALKLVQAVSTKLDNQKAHEEYLDLAALATIADIVDLKGENRIITKFGIEKILKRPCIGLKALIKVSAIQHGVMDSYRVAFTIAPRVNAAGRMGNARLAVDLFTTDDEAEAEKIALSLNQSNIKRQEVQDEIFKTAITIIESDSNYDKEKILIVHGNGWHHGVIGIVASKLVDRYHKPVFVISVEGDKAVGSGRSIEGFNLFSSMEAVSDILTKFGGHEQAGGLTLMAQDIKFFRSRINKYADDLITEEMLIPSILINMQAKGEDVSIKAAKLISCMEPFGAGNQMPLFMFRGAAVSAKKIIGNGKHLKLTLLIEGKNIEGVYFGKGNIEPGLFIGDMVDIVFTQEINNWQNNEYLQVKIWDMRLQKSTISRNSFLIEAARRVECLECDENWLYNGIIDKKINIDDITINRDTLTVIYKYITKNNIEAFSLADLFIHARVLEDEKKTSINYFKFLVSLLIFDELELLEIKLDSKGVYNIIRNDVKKVNLFDSRILEWINDTVSNFN